MKEIRFVGLNGKQQILCARVHGICDMLIPEWESKIGPIKHYSYCVGIQALTMAHINGLV